MTKAILIILVLFPCIVNAQNYSYLVSIKNELEKEWPHNRTINLVFHGHSVPTGYFKTPVINTFQSYPHLLLKEIKDKYPTASVNVIRTSIGGENSEEGAKRFLRDVLCHHPDVLMIDYALNDRSIGLERSYEALKEMIEMALSLDVKVLLLTPSPDLEINILNESNPLGLLTAQIEQLAIQFDIGLVNVFKVFQSIASEGKLENYMSQSNHPNEEGHRIIADEIMKYF